MPLTKANNIELCKTLLAFSLFPAPIASERMTLAPNEVPVKTTIIKLIRAVLEAIAPIDSAPSPALTVAKSIVVYKSCAIVASIAGMASKMILANKLPVVISRDLNKFLIDLSMPRNYIPKHTSNQENCSLIL